MSKKDIENANFEDTGYSYTLSLIAGKYKPIILYCLMEYEPVRFNEMQRYLKNRGALLPEEILRRGAQHRERRKPYDNRFGGRILSTWVTGGATSVAFTSR